MSPERQPLGRRRDSRVDHAILDATRDLLTDRGYAALTVDGVASHAGIGKAAIYRRYATKQEMVFAAAIHDMAPSVPPDSGSLVGDLQVLIGLILASLSTPATFAAMPGLLADLAADEALAARFTRTFLTAERDLIAEILQRAVHRGDLSALPDLDLAHGMLLGPIFAWLFLLRLGSDSTAEHAAGLAQLAAAALDTAALLHT